MAAALNKQIVAAVAMLLVVAVWSPTIAQSRYYYVANTRPPDAFLSLRTHPTSRKGLRIRKMPNGTLLEVLQRKSDGWWQVRVIPSGEEGWALSGQNGRAWIECCVTDTVSRKRRRAETDVIGFKTPSSNIHCQLEGSSSDAISVLRCDIRQLDSIPPPKPPYCELDWGQAFAITEDGRVGERICHGDTVINNDLLTLSYGSVWQRAGFTCKSERTGLTCINSPGHGFSLSTRH
jgi:hypothetical protein